MQASKTIKVAIFASGSGTNAQRIVDYFKEKEGVEIALLLSNNPDAYALTRAKAASIPTRVFTKAEFKDSTIIVDELKAAGISWVILAGFLWLVPKSLIQAFPNSILNIHRHNGIVWGHLAKRYALERKLSPSGPVTDVWISSMIRSL